MIEDIDESLRALVQPMAGTDVDVVFDAPTREWASRRLRPTVNLYLYDIREDLVRRQVAWEEVRDKTGRVTQRRPPPRRFRLSYLVTAWTTRAEDEHRLLSVLLTGLLQHDALPTALLAGAVAEAGTTVPITVGLPPPEDRSATDVWTAIGGELRPSIDLVVNCPAAVAISEPAGPPVLEQPRIRVDGEERAGRRKRPGAPAPEPVVAAEEFRAGTEAQPGRVIRLRGSARR